MTDEERLVERKLSGESVFDGKVLHLYRDTVGLPDGKTSTREYLRHIGAVCVLPLTEAREVVCVRQYRYPFAQVLTELPAGKLNSKTEDCVAAALRELREETGVTCRKLTDIGVYYSSPAILDEVIHLYLAEGLTDGETDPDEDEFLDVVRIPLSVLVEQILSGKIRDGKTQVAVLKVNEMLRQRDCGKE